MPDQTVRFDWEVDDSQVAAAMDKYLSNVEAAQAATDKLGDSQEQAFQAGAEALKDQEAALKSTIQQKTKYTKEANLAAKATGLLKKEATEAVRGVNLFGVNIGNAVDKLSALRSSTKSAQGGVKGLGGAWRVLNNILKVSVIGAIISVLVSLGAMLTKTQKGLDFLGQASAGLNATFGVLVDRVVKFGESVIKSFTAIYRLVQGDFTGAFEAATEAGEAAIATFTGLGTEIASVVGQAVALERVLQGVEKSERRVAGQRALANAEIKRLNLLIEDTTKGYNERISAAEKLQSIEASLNAQELTNARKRIAVAFGEQEVNDKVLKQIERIKQGRIDLNDLGLTSSTEADVDALLQDVEKLGQLEATSLEILTTNQNKLNTIRKEQRDRIQAVIEKTQELQNIAADANADLEGGAAVVEREFDKAIAKVEELKQAAREIGVDVDFSALEELARNQRQLALDAVKGVRAPFDELPNSLERTRQSLKDVTGRIRQDIVTSISTPLQSLDQDLADLPGDILGNLQDALNREAKDGLKLPPDVKEFLVGQFFDIFDSVGEVISLGLEGQAQRQQEVIDRIQKDIDKLSSDLNEQVERQQDGYANDAEAFKRNLQTKEQELAQAQQRQLELEKKAARQRLVLDSLQQASQLSLAVARLISSSASLGPFGIIAAATAGVSFIFSTIAKAKALALENSQPVGFATGTEYVDGPGSWISDSIPARLSRGERVLTGEQNHAIGGRGVSNDDLVNGYLFGQSVMDHLKSPSSAGPQNLTPILSILHQTQQELAELKSGAQIRAMERAYKQAARENADRMIQYWETRPVDLVDIKTGDKIRQWKEGNKINRIRIKEGKNE